MPSRRSLVEVVKDHPIVALSAYTIFLIGTVCVFIKNVGVKNLDYFGVKSEIAVLDKDLAEQREKTITAEKETVVAEKKCGAVEISALQARNDITNLRESLSRCEAAHPAPQPQVARARQIVPSEWKHQYMGVVTGDAVADRLSQLGLKPEDVVVFYDRANAAFHIWYIEKPPDHHIRYAYKVALPSDLGDRPGVNFFKQDAVTLPIGIGGSSPIPIYFRVERQ